MNSGQSSACIAFDSFDAISQHDSRQHQNEVLRIDKSATHDDCVDSPSREQREAIEAAYPRGKSTEGSSMVAAIPYLRYVWK